MKAFFVWIGISLAAFACAAVGYHVHLGENPRRTLVAIDDSHEMRKVWSQIPPMLDRLDETRYTQYALVTTKAKVHGWQPTLKLGAITPFAPRNLARLTGDARFADIDDADRLVLLTNAPAPALDALTDFEIIHLR